jgi:hypothetical protein
MTNVGHCDSVYDKKLYQMQKTFVNSNEYGVYQMLKKKKKFFRKSPYACNYVNHCIPIIIPEKGVVFILWNSYLVESLCI